MASLSTLIGPVLLDSGLKECKTEEVLASASIVAFYLADSRLSKCITTTKALKALFAEVAASAGAGKFQVIYVSQDDKPGFEAATADAPWLSLPHRTDAEDRIRRHFHLIAAVLPELYLVDAKTGTTLCSNGVQALQRQLLTSEAFPGWRTNCFLVQEQAHYDTSGVLLHPANLLRNGLYPGDTVMVKSQKDRLIAYANPPADEMDYPDPDAAVQVEQLSADIVALPGYMLKHLGLAAGDTVTLIPELEPLEATTVQVKVKATAAAAADATTAKDALAEYFGSAGMSKTAQMLSSMELAAGLGQEYMEALSLVAGSASLSSYVVSQRCRRRCIITGQQFVVAAPPGADTATAADVAPAADTTAADTTAADTTAADTTAAAAVAATPASAVEPTPCGAGGGAGAAGTAATAPTAPTSTASVTATTTATSAATGSHWLEFQVTHTAPGGPVIVGPKTVVELV